MYRTNHIAGQIPERLRRNKHRSGVEVNINNTTIINQKT
jgi:hypothetical protein